MHVDVFLVPHPEFFEMNAKRAKVKAGAPNPFVEPTEMKPYIEFLEAAFEKQLAAR